MRTFTEYTVGAVGNSSMMIAGAVVGMVTRPTHPIGAANSTPAILAMEVTCSGVIPPWPASATKLGSTRPDPPVPGASL